MFDSPRDRSMVSWRLDGWGLPGPEREVVMVMFLMAILLVVWSGSSSHHSISRSILGDTININNQQEETVRRSGGNIRMTSQDVPSIYILLLPWTLSVNLQTMNVTARVVQNLTIFQWPHHIYKDRIKLCKM